ncbi:hypothetical protein [Microbacterium sp. LWH3-1.2]|uniref:hypothetical protein n=1 Tax=Microbacterium sp. LWH3-1.2 TaxID=3135256 RepID=UPI003415305B
MSLFRRKKTLPAPVEGVPVEVLWRVDQYTGQSAVRVQATQLETHEASSAARRTLFEDWVRFLSTAETNIVDLDLVSRVPQDLVDAASGQRHLRKLAVKWGPYRDLSALSALRSLEELALGGATSVESLEPLTSLPVLSRLFVSQAHKADGAALGSLVQLRGRCFGNADLGSDKSVVLQDLRWVTSLNELRQLELPGTRLIDPDLTPLLELPHLENLRLPLRRAYRKQVLEFAARSSAFVGVASDYEEHDAFVASTRHR